MVGSTFRLLGPARLLGLCRARLCWHVHLRASLWSRSLLAVLVYLDQRLPHGSAALSL